MDIEETLKELLDKLLTLLGAEYSKIIVTEEDKDNFNINIISDNPSHLIGYHGENIHALQHVLKVLAWKKVDNRQFNILLDVDDYRKRQEENVVKLAQRKIDNVRQNGRPQHLPPMSPYFRRIVHTLCMGAGYEDVETISQGDADRRHVVIKSKS